VSTERDETGTGPEPTFDQSLERLEEVVRRLEDGSVDLDEAIRLFEEGKGLVARCRERLSVAQARIEELTAPTLPPAPGESDDERL